MVSVRLSVCPGADLGFRISTDGQDQVLKLRFLKLHGVCPSVRPSKCRSWFQDLNGRTGPGLEIEVPRWKRRTTTTNGGGGAGWLEWRSHELPSLVNLKEKE
jgi:hypothetical protein